LIGENRIISFIIPSPVRLFVECESFDFFPLKVMEEFKFAEGNRKGRNSEYNDSSAVQHCETRPEQQMKIAMYQRKGSYKCSVV